MLTNPLPAVSDDSNRAGSLSSAFPKEQSGEPGMIARGEATRRAAAAAAPRYDSAARRRLVGLVALDADGSPPSAKAASAPASGRSYGTGRSTAASTACTRWPATVGRSRSCRRTCATTRMPSTRSSVRRRFEPPPGDAEDDADARRVADRPGAAAHVHRDRDRGGARRRDRPPALTRRRRRPAS